MKKRKRRPECHPNNQIFLLKSESNGYCLKVLNELSLSMSQCNYSSPGQHWTQPRLFGTSAFAMWTHICLAYIDQCLTFASTLRNNFKREVLLAPFHHHEYAQQKWVVGDNGQIVNMKNGLRFVAYSNSKYPLNPPSYKGNKWRFEMDDNSKETLYKWSFLPVRDNNNATLCATDGLKN